MMHSGSEFNISHAGSSKHDNGNERKNRNAAFVRELLRMKPLPNCVKPYSTSYTLPSQLPLSPSTLQQQQQQQQSQPSQQSQQQQQRRRPKKTVRFSLKKEDLTDKPRARLYEPKVVVEGSGQKLV